MKIIIGVARSDVEDHAQQVIKNLEAYSMKHPSTVMPKGIAAYAVRYPTVCDDCGETFWSNDPYAVHPKCSKGKTKTGF